MSFTLDASVIFSTSGTNIALPGITTTMPNDVLLLLFASNISGGDISSISDTAGLTWTKRSEPSNPGFPFGIWWAPSTGTLSSNVITVHCSASASAFFGTVLAVNGSDLTSPFDTNVGLPASGNSGTATFSTTAAVTFAYGFYRAGGDIPSTGGWTVNPTASGAVTSAYQVFATAQTGQTIPDAGGSNNWMADALIAGSGPPPPTANTTNFFFGI